VKSNLEVNDGKDLSLLDPITNNVHQREWLSIDYRDFVEFLIVHAQFEASAIRLSNEDDMCYCW
jgi:hypothetical protein